MASRARRRSLEVPWMAACNRSTSSARARARSASACAIRAAFSGKSLAKGSTDSAGRPATRTMIGTLAIRSISKEAAGMTGAAPTLLEVRPEAYGAAAEIRLAGHVHQEVIEERFVERIEADLVGQAVQDLEERREDRPLGEGVDLAGGVA